MLNSGSNVDRNEEENAQCEFIGNVGLRLRQPRGSPSAPDLSFAVPRPFWGKGYATEAANAVLDFYEKEKGVVDVLGYCQPKNENSKKMFRRLGFVDAGIRNVKGIKGEGTLEVYAWVRSRTGKRIEAFGIGRE